MYGVVTELANVGSSLSFRRVLRGDGDKTKADIQLFLCRSARVRSSSTTTVAVPKNRPRRPKLVQVSIYGYETKAPLDSGTTLSLLSKKLHTKLNLEVNRHPIVLRTADGQRTRSI